MTESYIQLPDDSANTGKKVRSQSRTVGANTVHEHYNILTDITNDTQARIITSAPTTEAGLVVRNIPSGTQPVSGTVSATCSGTVAATQSGTWNITNLSGTVSLPTGAATETTLSALNGKVTACNTGAVVISSGSITASGTVTANQGTAAAGSAAWPTAITNTSDTIVKPGDAVNNAVRVNVVAGGAAGGTSSSFAAAFPATGTAAGFIDGSGNMQGGLVDGSGHLQVDVLSGGGGGTQYTLGTDTYAEATTKATMSGAVRNDVLATLVNTDNELAPLQVNASGALYCEVATSALPSGAATESTLSTLNGKVTACNTGAVVISSGTISLPTDAATQTTLSALNGKVTACNTGSIAGSVTANAGTNLNTSLLALETGGNLATIAGDTTSIDGKITACNTGAVVISSGTVNATCSGTVAATQSGTWNINNISGTVALPTDAATQTTLSALNGKVTACNTGAVVIASGTISLPTDAATQTTLSALNTKVTACNTGAVVISSGAVNATCSGTVAATQSGTWNITNISGTVSLPTDAATQTTLAALNTKVTACNTGAVVVSSGAITVSGTVTASNCAGDVAHDTGDSGNPIKIGGKARQANPTAVAALDRVDATFDDVGRQVVVLNNVRDLEVHQHTEIASSSSETTILSAGAAGIFHDLTQLILTNQTATAVNVTIKDATAGTTRMIIALAASGGAVIPFPTPVTQAAAANNWSATLSSAAVTVDIFVQAVKNV